MPELCPTLVCAPDIKKKLLDGLLSTNGDEVFTYTPRSSLGTVPGRLSSVEQVLGRSRSEQVQILVTEPEIARPLQQLRARFAGTGLRYGALRLAAQGEIEFRPDGFGSVGTTAVHRPDSSGTDVEGAHDVC